MKEIFFIPIDKRPVCYELPEMIANTDNNNLIFLPEKQYMGDLTTPSDTGEIIKFSQNIKMNSTIVVSLDTIAYGGLISSRRSTDSYDLIKKRINDFIEIIEKNECNVYAFSSIMRISNNNINEEEKEYWSEYGEKIYKYSYETDKFGHATSSEIPQYILDDYLATRKRNFEINKYYIELQKKGIFNTLIFSKDDCSEYGLNINESKELYKLGSGCKNIFIKTGADEIPLTLLSRALNKEKTIKVAPIYTYPGNIKKYQNTKI